MPKDLNNATAAPSSATASDRVGKDGRQKFAADELAIVLSHYDLGPIESVHEFPRGSRRAPKVLLRTEKGWFLLKRRARGKDEPFRVAFSHMLQLYLAGRRFPLPRLIGTRSDNNSMLQYKGAVYELFEYIRGSGYDNSLPATQDAGRTLGAFHKLLKGYQPEYEPPVGSYHAARAVQTSMNAVPRTLAASDPHARAHADRIEQVTAFLQRSYTESALRVNELGLTGWSMQIIHSDWHPGNMLFRGAKVVAVIDYDAARLQQRAIDVANGALQFSILGGGDDPAHWPDYLDASRLKRFLRGYLSVMPLSADERRTLPWLMIEALIAESVLPIAATGSFARIEGFGFLLMIERKVRWVQKHADQLARIAE